MTELPTATPTPPNKKDAATYLALFPDDQTRCAVAAPEANTGPLAYLVYLKGLAEALETRADVAQPVTLQQRRPDLLALALGTHNLKHEVPTLQIVNEVLEARVRDGLPSGEPVMEMFADRRTPVGFPFHYPWETIKATLALKGLFLWDVLRSTDLEYPNFTFDHLTSAALRASTTLSNGIGPVLVAKLASAWGDDLRYTLSQYQMDEAWINTTGAAKAVCTVLGLSRQQLRSLLAVSAVGEGHTLVTRSPLVAPGEAGPATSAAAGAAFINNGRAPLYLSVPAADAKALKVEGLTANHLDRMLRMVRFQHALKLDAAEVDALIMAASHAQRRNDHDFNTDTMRALGLFRHWQQKYGATPGQFAACLHQLSPYGIGGTPSVLDQVFNPNAHGTPTPDPLLSLDGSAFDPLATEGPDALTVRQLCAGLRVDEALLRVMLQQVCTAQALAQPTRSLAVVSACYRLAAVPRLFGLSPRQGWLLLSLLAQEKPAYFTQLAGQPRLLSTVGSGDIVDVLTGWMNAAEWLRAQALPTELLHRALTHAIAPYRQEWVNAFANELLAEGDLAPLFATLAKAFSGTDGELMKLLVQWAGLDPEALRGRIVTLREQVKAGGSVLEHFTADDFANWAALERRALLVTLLGLDVATLRQVVEHPAYFNLEAGDLAPGAAGQVRPLDLTTVYQLTRYKALLAQAGTGRQADLLSYLRSRASATAPAAGGAWATLESVFKQPAGSLASIRALAPPANLRELDRLARVLALAEHTRLSVDALLDLGTLRGQPAYADFERAAVALRKGCTPAQRTALDEQMALAWRDAMLSYLLDLRASLHPERARLQSAQALTDYLLIDVQVSHEPRTTRIASAITSLQRYLHQLYARLEPGYRDAEFSPQAREEWEQFGSSYERWKLRQQVRNEPQNYVDPTRRKRQTTAFAALQNLLSQGKCQPQDIHTAMLQYLSAFETLSNIQPISVYADGTTPLTDTYHFIGKTNVAPVEYYWRTLDLSQRDPLGAPSMLAWGEWEKISLSLGGTLVTTPLPKAAATPAGGATDLVSYADQAGKLAEDNRQAIELIRPVIIAGRRYAVWVERSATPIALPPDNKASDYYALRVCFAYLQTDGAWSSANTLLCLDGHDRDGTFATPDAATPTHGTAGNNAFLKTRAFQPGLAVMVNNTGDRANDPWLTVLLFDTQASAPSADKSWERDKDYFLVVKDLLLIEDKRLDAGDTASRPIEARLVKRWQSFFRDPRVVQHPYVGALVELEEKADAASDKAFAWAASDGALANIYDVPEKGALGISATLHWDRNIIEITADLTSRWETKEGTWTIKAFDLFDKKNEAIYRLSQSLTKLKRSEGGQLAAGNHSLSGKAWVLTSTLTGLDAQCDSYYFNKNIFTPFTSKTADLSSLFGNVGKGKTTKYTHLYSEYQSPLRHIKLDLFSRNNQLQPINTVKADLLEAQKNNYGYADCHIVLTISIHEKSKPSWTFSPKENALVEQFGIVGLSLWASENQDTFRTFKKALLAQAYTTETRFSEVTGIAVPPGVGKPLALDKAIVRATELNKADAIAAFINEHTTALTESLKAQKVEVPKNIDLTSVVRLLHFHPTECLRILLYLDPAHTMVFEQQVQADGKGRVTFNCPINRDITDYTFTLEVKDPKLGDSVLGSLEKTYTLVDLNDDAVPSVQLWRNAEQAVYLDLTEANAKVAPEQRLAIPSLRLNTLFGKQLVALATQSVASALSWEAQCLPEPRLEPGSVPSTVDFRGANGLYFWELFFHVPLLVSWLLRQNHEYREAWRWCTQYLFDPYRTRTAGTRQPSTFWLAQPITDSAAYVASADENDPDLLAYAAPERYRKALLLFVVQNWQRQGDDLYRQLTRDSLAEASVRYDQALRLIGTLAEHTPAGPAAALTLASATPAAFIAPVNERLAELRTLLRNRLFNLRHGLTLDGKRAAVSLGLSDTDQALLSHGFAGAGFGSERNRARAVPPSRYELVRQQADNAVLQLIELGQTLLRFYEAEAAQRVALIGKTSHIRLLDFTCRLQKQAVKAARRGRETLLASQQMVKQRQAYYQGLVDEGITDLEHASQAFAYASQVLLGTSIPFEVAAGSVEAAVPTIFGLAFGGNKPGQPMARTAVVCGTLSHLAEIAKDELRLQADYQLRAQEWQFETDQATLELAVLDQQLLEQDIEIQATEIAYDEARAQQAAQRAEYEVMTSVFASLPTYEWLIARLAEIYATAYDATLSLCLMAEACLQYELGDFSSTWIKTDGWVDNWRGMLAGEALERDLMKMDLALAMDNERPLDIRLDLSLCKVMGWTAEQLQAHIAAGSVPFDLSARQFDAQYPGQYLRRLERIVLTFQGDKKTLNGSMAAMLVQTKNTVLLSPDVEGAKRLYATTEGSEHNLLRDLRPNQQAAIWSTRDVTRNFDLQPSPKDETRYQPFEGTGAISSWMLSLPGGKAANPALYEGEQCVVHDIAMQVSYSALRGDSAFENAVMGLMADYPALTPQQKATQEAEQAKAEAQRKADAEAAATVKRQAEAAAKAKAEQAAKDAEAKAAQAAEAAQAAKKAKQAAVQAVLDQAKACGSATVNITYKDPLASGGKAAESRGVITRINEEKSYLVFQFSSSNRERSLYLADIQKIEKVGK